MIDMIHQKVQFGDFWSMVLCFLIFGFFTSHVVKSNLILIWNPMTFMTWVCFFDLPIYYSLGWFKFATTTAMMKWQNDDELNLTIHAQFGGRNNNVLTSTHVTYLHCNPLQGNYRVELLHREIPVVITGNEFTEYNFLVFWLHFFPCLLTLKLLL